MLIFAVGFAYGVENLLENGDFETGQLDPWHSYGDRLTLEVVQENPIQGKYCLKATLSGPGANFWDDGIQHQQRVFEQGKKYTLAAFIRSDDPNMEVNFKPELAADPWTGYGSQIFAITPDWTDYHVTTPEMEAKVDPAQITFHVSFAKGVLYFDYVRFYEGDYVEPDLGGPAAVSPRAKLTTTWGQLKVR